MGFPERRRRHLRAVPEDGQPERDPRDPRVWRAGLDAARASLASTGRSSSPAEPVRLMSCFVCGLPTPRVDDDEIPMCAECLRVEAAEEEEEIDPAELEASRRRHPARPGPFPPEH